MTENPCCDEYERMTALSRRRFLGGVAAAGATAVTTNLFGEAVQQASFGADRRQRPGRAQLPRRDRRARAGRAPRRPRLLHRPAQHRAAAQLAGLHRRDVRAPPQDGAAASGSGTPASSPPSTPSGCRCRTARTSPRWRRSRTPTPARRLRQGWVNRMVGLDAPATERHVAGQRHRAHHHRGPEPADGRRRRSTTSRCAGPRTAGRPRGAATSRPPGASRPGRWDAPPGSRWTRWRGSSRSSTARYTPDAAYPTDLAGQGPRPTR